MVLELCQDCRLDRLSALRNEGVEREVAGRP